MIMVFPHHRFFPYHPNISCILWSIEFSKWIKQQQENTLITRKTLQTCQQQTVNQDEAVCCTYNLQVLTARQLLSISNNCFRSTKSTWSHGNMHELNWYITIQFTKCTFSSHNILYMTLFLLTTCIPVPLHNNWSHGSLKQKSCYM